MKIPHAAIALAGVLPAFLSCLLSAGAAWGYSLRPLVTEEAQPLPSGIVQGTLGLQYANDAHFPFFTPPDLESQDVIAVPQFGFRIGAGNWVEIQATYELIYLDERTTAGDSQSEYGGGDARLFTKIRLLQEDGAFPALGLRFGTKLPNANRESGLGTDEIDFGGEFLASKALGPVALHVNLGLQLLGVPQPEPGDDFSGGGQDDLFSYSVAVSSSRLGESAPGATQLVVMGEVAGLAGSRFSNDRSAAQLGLQLVRGAATLFLGVSAGLISDSERVGASAGFIYTFDLAEIFRGAPLEQNSAGP